MYAGSQYLVTCGFVLPNMVKFSRRGGYFMDITLLIATIGCITGLSSLLIQFFSFLSTVPRLKIAIDESSHSYFFRPFP